MTRNSRKLKPQINSEYKEPPKQEEQKEPETPKPQVPKQPDNPFGLSFVTPTEFVELPSSGNYYPLTSPLSAVERVEIRHMTAKEEDILSSVTESDSSAFEKLIDSLLLDDNLSADMFLEEDKMAILLKARTTGYGSIYESTVMCTSCNERTKHIFDLSKVSKTKIDDAEIVYTPETNTFRYILKVSDVEVELINLAPEHEKEMEDEKKQKEKYNLPFNYTLAFLEKTIVSANDITDRKLIKQLIDVLPASDAKQVLNFYNACRPTLSTKQEVSCEVCKTRTEREAPISWAFFRTDV